MNIRYRVELDEVERIQLKAMVRGGRHAAGNVKQAQTLPAADAGGGVSAVYRTKGRFVEVSLEATLSEDPHLGTARCCPPTPVASCPGR